MKMLQTNFLCCIDFIYLLLDPIFAYLLYLTFRKTLAHKERDWKD